VVLHRSDGVIGKDNRRCGAARSTERPKASGWERQCLQDLCCFACVPYSIATSSEFGTLLLACSSREMPNALFHHQEQRRRQVPQCRKTNHLRRVEAHFCSTGGWCCTSPNDALKNAAASSRSAGFTWLEGSLSQYPGRCSGWRVVIFGHRLTCVAFFGPAEACENGVLGETRSHEESPIQRRADGDDPPRGRPTARPEVANKHGVSDQTI